MQFEKRKRGRPPLKLSPESLDSTAALIGFKASKDLKNDIEKCAESLGLSVSDFIRVAVSESVAIFKKNIGVRH
jgi:uncharacterized protein (DUF1778 family)